MTNGIFLGLMAALFWGVADFCARGSARLGGTFLTLLCIQIVSVAAFLTVCLPLGLVTLRGVPPVPALAAVVISLSIMAGAGFLYRAFAVGKISITSPIAASFAAVTTLLALASGERPTAPQLAGIALTLGGVVLASSMPGEEKPMARGERETTVHRATRLEPGLIQALISMLIFGVAYWALRFVVGPLGGIEVAFLAKIADLIVLSALAIGGTLWFRLRAHSSQRQTRPWYAPARPPAAFWLFVVPNSLLDTTANIAYNVGITQGLVSVVVVLSSLFSAVTVLLAWIFLRERLRGWQWLGVLAIFLGIALVSW